MDSGGDCVWFACSERASLSLFNKYWTSVGLRIFVAWAEREWGNRQICQTVIKWWICAVLIYVLDLWIIKWWIGTVLSA